MAKTKQQNDEPKNTVTIAELARYLGISKASVYSKLYDGSLGLQYIQLGKMVRFLKTDVDEWINKKREESKKVIKNGK